MNTGHYKLYYHKYLIENHEYIHENVSLFFLSLFAKVNFLFNPTFSTGSKAFESRYVNELIKFYILVVKYNGINNFKGIMWSTN